MAKNISSMLKEAEAKLQILVNDNDECEKQLQEPVKQQQIV